MGGAPQQIGLFEGYGGLSMAVREVLGAELVAYSEITAGPCKVLGHRHPGVPNLGDVTAVAWTAVAAGIDRSRPLIVTGGFPCQDVSSAGRHAGIRPGTRSGLWTHMAYGIDQLRPDLVVIENVRGLLSADADCDLEPCPWCMGDDEGRPLRALGAVLGDLAELGYDARWCGLRAADVGAPHGRFRVFIVAWPATDPDGSGRHGAAADDGACGSTEGESSAIVWHGGCRCVAPDLGCDGSEEGEGRHPRSEWGAYELAIRRWESILGRVAPGPTQAGTRGGTQLSARFVEWLMGLPDGYVTKVPGLSRSEQLTCLGNGVVPQQAAAALRYLVPFAAEAGDGRGPYARRSGAPVEEAV